jgi:GNAT superfamily N-acetyltransferase
MIFNRAKRKFKIKLQKVKEYYAEHGLFSTIMHYLMSIFWKISKNVIFFELDLDNMSLPQLIDKYGIKVIKIEKTNFDRLDYHGWEITKQEALNRLNEGCVLFAGIAGETMVSQQWTELKKAYLFGLDLTVNLPDYTGYISRLYTDSNLRGKGIATFTKAQALLLLKDYGCTSALVIIAEENQISRHVNGKFGFKPYQAVKYHRFLFFIKYYRVKDFSSDRKKHFFYFTNNDQKLWKFYSKIHL